MVTTYQKYFSKTVPTCGSDNLIKSHRHLYNKALFHFCCKTRCISALEVFLHEIKSMTHTHPFDDLSKLRRTTKEHFHFAFPFLGYFVKNLQNKTLYQRAWYKEKRGLICFNANKFGDISIYHGTISFNLLIGFKRCGFI